MAKHAFFISIGTLWETSKVTSIVLSVLNHGDDIGPFINDTNIFLIPKIKNFSLVKDYRPISLCNVIHKLISKIIVNKLKAHMTSIIHDN